MVFDARPTDGGYDADLATVTSTLGSGFTQNLGIDQAGTTRTPIDLVLQGDGGYAWTASMETVVELAERGGGGVDPLTERGLRASEISTTLRASRTGEAIKAPPLELVVEVDLADPALADQQVADCFGFAGAVAGTPA